MLYKNAADQLKSVFLRTLLPVLAAGVLALSPAAQVNASRLSDLKQQKSQTQEKLNAANNKSDSLEGQEEALSEAEAAVSQDLVQNMASVQMLEQEIDKLNTQIDEKQKEYDAAKAKEDHQYELMKIRIKYMYEKGNTDYVEILMHATSLTDMLNKSEYISKLYDYDRKLLKEYQETRRQTAAAKTALVDKKSEQEESKAGLVEEQSALQSQISDLKAKHSNVNAQIEEARRQASALAQQLQEQTAAISAEVEAQAKAAEEARKKAEAEAAAKKAAQEALDKSKTSNTQNSVKAVNGSSLPVVENSSSQDAADSSGSSGSSGSSSSSGISGQDIVAYASQFLGNPYVYGGTSLTNGTDCSGFTQSVYSHFGYSLGRTDVSQRSNGTVVASLADAKPGDLICYPGHVAIYCGNGTIIHASTPATGIKYSAATYRAYVTIRRIIN